MPNAPTPQPLDRDECYPALLARDARFDGRWFVAVSSTGIYCRPICRVRTPRRENCRFFATAAQAEAARYRPCLKCRPELAPAALGRAWSVMEASRTLALEAARRLERLELAADRSVADLAAELGISDRHLRRIFLNEHGVTPLQYLQTRRLLLAKQLLSDTALPVTEVALLAGFGSLRRFNAAFVEHYRLQPSALRRQGTRSTPRTGAAPAAAEPALALSYRPPYAARELLEFLAARAIPGVEHVDVAAGRLQRSLRLRHGGTLHQGRLTLRFDTEGRRVWLQPCSALWPAVAALLPLVRRWLDLDAEPLGIAEGLNGLPQAVPGLRLPGTPDRFELALRAVLGQQVTVAAARTLATRLVQRFGVPLPASAATAEVQRCFPSPEQLAAVDAGEIAALGIIRRRADTMLALARAWPTLRFAQGPGEAGALEAARAELLALPGIGPWTAHYMLMRGWSWPDAWPSGDIVLRRQLSPDPAQPLANALIDRQAQAWQPWRSYAVLQLWRQASRQTEGLKQARSPS